MTEAKKGARLTGADRIRMGERVQALYADGKSIRAIAQDTGRSYGFVHRVLTEHRVPLRSRGGAIRRQQD